MGRLESLSAWALGRGHYDEEVIWGPEGREPQGQQYNARGYPRNPRTKLREKDNVRAANEVMQTTGVVEDAEVAKGKIQAEMAAKNQETFTGLRLMEVGKAALVGGVWGVLGLRRRILLYKPYSKTSLYEILRHEVSTKSMPRLTWSGLPTVVAYHVSEWVAFFLETVLDAVIDEDENASERARNFKVVLQRFLDVGFCYITLHFRMFAILQQLNLIPSSRSLPSMRSFIPFSATSPLQFPLLPSSSPESVVSYALALIRTATPMLTILIYGKLKYAVSRIIYRPIYKILPRPTGDSSMFSGLAISAPTMEYDTPDRPFDDRTVFRSEDEPTLRALEGLPVTDQMEPIRNEPDHSSSDEEEDNTPTTLISFDVEEAENRVENTQGTWSAELRSAQEESKLSPTVRYRITGLTMLPPIMATEGLRDVFAGVLVMPIEALMVRVIGRAYRVSAGLPLTDIYEINKGIYGLGNIFSALTIQLAITGIVWAGFVGGTQWWASRQRSSSRASAKGVGGENVQPN